MFKSQLTNFPKLLFPLSSTHKAIVFSDCAECLGQAWKPAEGERKTSGDLVLFILRRFVPSTALLA